MWRGRGKIATVIIQEAWFKFKNVINSLKEKHFLIENVMFVLYEARNRGRRDIEKKMFLCPLCQ